ncbi:MAG: NADP-dependent malic enzyme, partial [Proteobacteria bacterium]|nr:NADP-dependent malic enzyme [Pseudomonadota bacterium]
MTDSIYKRSLDYHKQKPYGKLSIQATKSLDDQRDLSLAYSPGVAAPCEEIVKDPNQAAYLTSKGNLIAVISNGTAVLGLGNIGALASKPVMEGKAVLFKKFSGIDAFDIEINETDPDKLIDIIASLEPTFGGINLEDIKAPECFYIEQELKKRLKIPIIHDDQHGTAIVVAAALENALILKNKKLCDVKLVCNGAGAAAIACVDLLCLMGLKRENVLMLDRKGVLTEKRKAELDFVKQKYMVDTNCQTLEDAMRGGDVFLGLSSANVVSKEMVLSMAKDPIIFALANPEPEIHPSLIEEVRDDAIIATGRSDFSNQVNNALCYPYLFRGALDVGATCINENMKIACVHAIAKIARSTVTDVVSRAYGGKDHSFGKDYIIPKPFDKRLFVDVSMAVAKAAMDSGVATRPISDFKKYNQELEEFVYRSFQVMRPIFEEVRGSKNDQKLKRLAFAEGEETRVLQAAQQLVDEQICHPILIGRPDIIEQRIKALHLSLKEGVDYTLIDPAFDERFNAYWTYYHTLVGRKGISPAIAKTIVRTNTTVIASLLVKLGDADGMICGTVGAYVNHFQWIRPIIGIKEGIKKCSTLCVMILEKETLFITDPYLIPYPTVEELIEMVDLSIETMSSFNIEPKIALLSGSNFGSNKREDSVRMKQATKILQEKYQSLQIDGEMQADSALLPHIRDRWLPDSKLIHSANLLVMPNIDAANI